jgi:hypothetical protein
MTRRLLYACDAPHGPTRQALSKWHNVNDVLLAYTWRGECMLVVIYKVTSPSCSGILSIAQRTWTQQIEEHSLFRKFQETRRAQGNGVVVFSPIVEGH